MTNDTYQLQPDGMQAATSVQNQGSDLARTGYVHAWKADPTAAALATAGGLAIYVLVDSIMNHNAQKAVPADTQQARKTAEASVS